MIPYSVSKAALNMLDGEEMEIVGRKLTEIPCVSEIARAVKSALESGVPLDRGEVEVSLDEHKLPVGLSVSFMTGHGGGVQGAVANFRDLSQVKKMAEQIKRQEQLAALGEMAAGVAHEIRNPLNSIRGFAQLLGERVGPKITGAGKPGENDQPPEAEYVGIIVEEVDRMNGIVQDLLDFARQRQITMSRVSVVDALRGVIRQVTQEAGEHGVSIEERIDDDLPRSYGNGSKLRQVFMNIARNAIQAMGSGGKLTIGARLVTPGLEDGPRELAITFADTGPGIPEEARKKIFDPFFTTKDVGTGLGLAICAKIMESHNGRIELESTPGQGAVFSVLLPAPAQGDTDKFPPVS